MATASNMRKGGFVKSASGATRASLANTNNKAMNRSSVGASMTMDNVQSNKQLIQEKPNLQNYSS